MTSVDIEGLLGRVEKPARYTGGEYNSVYKDEREVEIRFAFAFPTCTKSPCPTLD